MIFSDALPVQFWLSDCNTYNETVPKGVHEQCFCAPWQCDDEIRIQFQEGISPDGDYFLGIKNADGDYLTALPFTEIESGIHSLNFSPETEDICDEVIALEVLNSDDVTLCPSPSQWQDDPAITIAFDSKGVSTFHETMGNGFKVAYMDLVVPVGATVRMQVSVTITGIPALGSVEVKIYLTNGSAASSSDTDSMAIMTTDGTFTEELVVTRTGSTSSRLYIRLDHFNAASGLDTDITVPVSAPVYINPDATPLAKSDCLQIATTQDETHLIEYSNERNFAGLNYTDISPDAAFNIRVPSRFFHEEFPEEDEAMELTSSVITTSSQLKSQKLLEVKHVPYYFHKKLQLILKHQTLTINDIAYKKEEKYQINQGNKRWPLKSATCLLTEKNSVMRNIL
jgi:hypothetical protein